MALNTKKIALFVGLTYGLSWLLFVMSMGVISTFVPLIVAFFTQRFVYRQPMKQMLGTRFGLNRWFFIALFLPSAIALATFGVSLLLPDVSYSPDLTGLFERMKTVSSSEDVVRMEAGFSMARNDPILALFSVWIAGLFNGITVGGLKAVGEEVGWRGFLQTELSHMGFWKSSAVVGVIWGIWHAPSVLGGGRDYPLHPWEGVMMMIIVTVLLSPIFSYVRVKAGSVIAVAIIHGAFNGSTLLATLLVKGGDDLTVGLGGLAGLIVLLLANVCLFWYDHSLAKEHIMGREYPRFLKSHACPPAHVNTGSKR